MQHEVASWSVESDAESRRILFDELHNPTVILVGFNDPLNATGGIGTVMRAIERHLAHFHLVFWNPARDRRCDPSGRWIWPVELPQDLVLRFQRAFLKQYIWPCLHGLPSSLDALEIDNLRPAMEEASGRFADAIVRLIELVPDDREIVVWFNDYAVVWCLSDLRRRLDTSARIGATFRCPFGATEPPRLLPCDGDTLVSNLCSADFLSFHRARDVQHFLKAAESSRTVAHGLVVTEARDSCTGLRHLTHVRAVPMGNDPVEIREVARSHATESRMCELKRLAGGAQIIASVSRLEPHKGIVREVEMLSSLLSTHPSLIGRVSLVRLMPIPPEYGSLESYRDLYQQIQRQTDLLNQRFASGNWRPVHLLSERVYGRHEVLALLRAAHVVLVLSKADGFSHIPIETLLAKCEGDPCPVLLLSDVGATDYLTDSFLKFEDSGSETSSAMLYCALMLDDDVRRTMFEEGQRRCETLSAHQWAVSVLTGIVRPDLLEKMIWPHWTVR